MKNYCIILVSLILTLLFFGNTSAGNWGPNKINENWSANCVTDQVNGTKECFVGTFGRSLGHDGTPYGRKGIPFKVIFVNGHGPYIQAGFHTYPGRTPLVRIDDNKALEVHNDAGVSEPQPNPDIVEQMLSGKVARVRYHVWPDGKKDMYVDLTGFEEAWERLNQMISK